jgi:hypothetical protein
MGFRGGDPAHIDAAATLMKPVVTAVDGQSKSLTAAWKQASGAAGDPRVAAAIDALGRALATAADDTGTAVGQLGEVAEATATNLRKAGGK